MLNENEIQLLNRNISNQLVNVSYLLQISTNLIENNNDVENGLKELYGHFTRLLQNSGFLPLGQPIKIVDANNNNLPVQIKIVDKDPSKFRGRRPRADNGNVDSNKVHYLLSFTIPTNVSTNFLPSHSQTLERVLRAINISSLLPSIIPFSQNFSFDDDKGGGSILGKAATIPNYVYFIDNDNPVNRYEASQEDHQKKLDAVELNRKIVLGLLPELFNKTINDIVVAQQADQENDEKKQAVETKIRAKQLNFDIKSFVVNMYGCGLVNKDILQLSQNHLPSNYDFNLPSVSEKLTYTDETYNELVKVNSIIGPNSKQLTQKGRDYGDKIRARIASKLNLKTRNDILDNYEKYQAECKDEVSKDNAKAIEIINEVIQKLTVNLLDKLSHNNTFSEESLNLLATAKNQDDFDQALTKMRESSWKTFDYILETAYYKPLQEAILSDENLHSLLYTRIVLSEKAEQECKEAAAKNEPKNKLK